jgi:aspartyl protease family protein
VKGHLVWVIFWVGLLVAGYLVSDRLLAPPAAVRMVAKGQNEIVVPVARDGHYYLDGSVNNVPVRFMVDTGASYVSVGSGFAQGAGLGDGIRASFNTANGTVEGRIVKNQTVRADALEIAGLSVAVMPEQRGDALLGQNFLRHFEVTQSAGALRLRMRNDGPDRQRD